MTWGVALPSMAQGAEPPAAGTIGSNPIRDGSAAVGLLALLSTAALAASIDLALRLRRDRQAPADLAEALDRECRDGRPAEAQAIADEAGDSCLLATAVSAGLRRAERPGASVSDILRAAEDAGRRGASRLDRRIALIAAIGLAALPIGLVGTVQAIISGSSASSNLASLIGRSLSPTLWGLVASIVAQGAAALLRIRLDSLADAVAERAESILESLGVNSS